VNGKRSGMKARRHQLITPSLNPQMGGFPCSYSISNFPCLIFSTGIPLLTDHAFTGHQENTLPVADHNLHHCPCKEPMRLCTHMYTFCAL
jgi:hypothetical protein